MRWVLDNRLRAIEDKVSSIDERSLPIEDVDKRLANLSWFAFTGRTNIPSRPSGVAWVPGSIKQREILQDDYLYWLSELELAPRIDNKLWQYVTLLHNVNTHFKTFETSGGSRSAIVFGVGKEPTVSYFAKSGWNVLATDYLENEIAGEWGESGQLSTKKSDLLVHNLCSPEVFERRVEFMSLDMNQLPSELEGKFDLVWSLCALGHIGGYSEGLRFVENSARLLKPNGLAVHTTEMDSSLVLEKFDTPNLSFYKRSDLERLVTRLDEMGLDVPEHDFSLGPGILDEELDIAPFRRFGHHVRFRFDDRIVTPVSLVFGKLR